MITSDNTPNVADDLAADLAALVVAPRYRPGPPCGMALVLGQLEGTKAGDDLATIVDNKSVTAAKIAEALTGRGYPMASQTVSRHRRRGQHNGCRCAP